MENSQMKELLTVNAVGLGLPITVRGFSNIN